MQWIQSRLRRPVACIITTVTGRPSAGQCTRPRWDLLLRPGRALTGEGGHSGRAADPRRDHVEHLGGRQVRDRAHPGSHRQWDRRVYLQLVHGERQPHRRVAHADVWPRDRRDQPDRIWTLAQRRHHRRCRCARQHLGISRLADAVRHARPTARFVRPAGHAPTGVREQRLRHRKLHRSPARIGPGADRESRDLPACLLVADLRRT